MSHRSFSSLLPLVAVIALAALASGGARSAQGASFTVDATHDAIDAAPGDGICADATGACTLRAAVMETNALPGADGIALMSEAYALTIPGAFEDGAASGDLDISDDLSLSAPIIINGSSTPTGVIDGSGLDRVIHVTSASQVILDGLIVQGGAVAGDFAFGGGVRNDSGALTLRDSVIRANTAAFFGGGVFSGAASATTIVASVITGNNAREGGGIFTVSDSLTSVQHSVISGNTAVARGGGITNGGSASLSILRTTVAGNAAGDSGAGINNFGNASIVETSVLNNESGNSVTGFGGGGIDSGGGSLVVTASTISGNTGIGLITGTLQPPTEPSPPATTALTNVTISGNNGGIFSQHNSQATLLNVTIADNTIVGISNSSGSDVRAANSLVARKPPAPACSGPVTSLGHNLDSDGTCGLTGPGDLSNVDPLLEPLADNGGPTLTHMIRGGGPAIDAGDNAACLPTDQRGFFRPWDANGDNVAVCDMGAVESQLISGPPPVPCPAGQSCPPCPAGVAGCALLPTPTPVSPITLPPTGGDTGPPNPLSLVVMAIALPALALAAAAIARRVFTHR